MSCSFPVVLLGCADSAVSNLPDALKLLYVIARAFLWPHPPLLPIAWYVLP